MHKLFMKIFLLLTLIACGSDAWAQTHYWRKVNNGPWGGIIDAMLVEPTGEYILAGGYRGIYRSQDQGNSWTNVYSKLGDIDVSSFAIHPDSTSDIYAAGEYGLLRSTDDGASWSSQGNSPPIWDVTSLLIVPANGPLPNGRIFIAGNGNNPVAYSDDLGSTWTYSATLPQGGDGRTMAYDASSDKVLVGGWFSGGPNPGIYISAARNPTLSWSATTFPVSDCFALAIANNNRILAGTNASNFLYYSDNGGASWTGVSNIFSGISSLAANGNHIVAGKGFRYSQWGSPVNGILYSTDNGANWENASGDAKPMVYAIALLSNGRLFASTDDGIYSSSNDGYSWIAKNKGLYIPVWNWITFRRDDETKILAATDGGGVRELAWQDEWRQHGLSNNAGGFCALANGDILAGTDDGVFRYSGNRSRDDEWQNSSYGLPNEPGVRSLAQNPVTGRLFAACHRDIGVYYSDTNGHNWTQLTVPFFPDDDVEMIVTKSTGDIYAGTWGNSPKRTHSDKRTPRGNGGIWRSTNNGVNWSQVLDVGVDNGAPRIAISPTTGDIFTSTVGPNPGIYRSTTGNVGTWSKITTGNNVFVGLTINSKGNIFIASGGSLGRGDFDRGVYRSNDNGTTWVRAVNGLPLDASGDPTTIGLSLLVVEDTFLGHESIILGTDTGVFRRNVVSDFDQDGGTEILWRNSQDGRNALWYANQKTAVHADIPGVPDQTYEIAGIGDFSGIGASEILWRNYSASHANAGGNYIWSMDGSDVQQITSITSIPDTNWEVAGIGDFDGDGKSDILWRHTTGAIYMWLMDGSEVKSTADMGWLDPAVWQIEGIGDFDGDGKSDIFWHHATAYYNYVWFMNGTTVRESLGTIYITDSNWQITGLGDFDGDGKSDILLHHGPSALNYIWFMDKVTLKNGLGIDVLGGTWGVAAIGDFDSNGQADLIWRNTSTGGNQMWLMSGTATSLTTTIVTMPTHTTDWNVVGYGLSAIRAEEVATMPTNGIMRIQPPCAWNMLEHLHPGLKMETATPRPQMPMVGEVKVKKIK